MRQKLIAKDFPVSGSVENTQAQIDEMQESKAQKWKIGIFGLGGVYMFVVLSTVQPCTRV